MAVFYNRGVNNTAFSPNSDKVAQITGSGQPVAGATTLVLAATIALDSYQVYSNFFSLTNTAGISAVTVTSGYIPSAGAQMEIQFNQFSGGAGALTFGTGFRSTGTLTPGSAKARLVEFISDGTTWNEGGRSSADI